MYLDVKGLVTTCVGNLIDTPHEAAKLPWRHGAEGPLVTRDEVFAAWHALKARQDLAKKHWRFAAQLNDLRLTEEAMDELVAKKRGEFYAYMKQHHFPAIDDYPADAQLGLLSMAWACGPGFARTFRNFARWAVDGNWASAAAACKIREEGNPGIVPRNKANRICFGNAAIVIQRNLDRERLHWPATLAQENVEPTPTAAVPPAPVRPTLRRGSGDRPEERGHVRALQQLLNRLVLASATGVKPLAVDGEFGPKTEAVVRAFQQIRGLKPDGIVGPKTWAQLESE